MGIDAKKTHVIIIQKLLEIERRLDRLERGDESCPRRLVLTSRAGGRLAVPAASGSARGARDAPATWRVDYYHTGGLGLEAFSLDRVVVEPLPWPGNPDGFVDRADTGTYRFRVESEDGRVLYARGLLVDLRRVAEHRRGRRAAPHLPGVAALSGP